MAGQTVQPEEILKSSEGDVRLRKVHEWAMDMATVLGLFIFLVTVFAIGLWWWWSPSPPVISTGMTADQLKILLEGHRTISEAVLESVMKMFDLVVVKTLLPVFTSILGFLFGTRAAQSGK